MRSIWVCRKERSATEAHDRVIRIHWHTDAAAPGSAAGPPHAAAGRWPLLLRGADASKDQSYFLASVPGAALQRCAFPLGGASKAAVR